MWLARRSTDTMISRRFLSLLLAPVLTASPDSNSEISEENRLVFLIVTGQYELALEDMETSLYINAEDQWGRTPLGRAARLSIDDSYDMVHALLLRGADPNLREGEGITPLHHAARAGTLSVVHLLVDSHGAKVNVPQIQHDGTADWNETPIVWAASAGNIRVARFLESRGAVYPPHLERLMRYKLLVQSHLQKIRGPLSSRSEKKRGRYSYALSREKAELMAFDQLGATSLILDYKRAIIESMEAMLSELEWENESAWKFRAEAKKRAYLRFDHLEGFSESVQAWNSQFQD